ncbi:hypothetical protein [Terrabacter sp. 2RAF25]|uniref:hypothetical protein n=1 Tax=Terrabacter sp. 2RAF25 TaxID=3232998 RepID=UPI003F97BC63
MSDPDTKRPELPDPQHDHHVAFPDEGVDGRAASTGAFGASLPPEAWAPRPVENTSSAASASSTSTWQPDVRPGSILTTPPNRPYQPAARRTNGSTGSTGAKVLAALVLVPMAMAFCSSGSHDQYGYTGDGGTGVEMPMGGDIPMAADPVSVDPVVVEMAPDTSGVLPPLTGKPKTAAVPVGAPELRVEVVSLPTADAGPSAEVMVQTFANDFATDTSSGALPFAATVHLNERPSRLQMTASVVSGTGQLQCRVYAGDRLVAISSGGATVTCSPEM